MGTKPVRGAPDETRNDAVGGRGVAPAQPGASPAPSARVSHTPVCPGDPGVGGCAQGGRSATRVSLPTPEALSSPTASGQGMEPGLWARVKSCTIFCRRRVCAHREPTNTAECAHTVTHG